MTRKTYKYLDREEKSQRAFKRMAYSKKYGRYANAWRNFCFANDNNLARKVITDNHELLAAYNAVLNAITAPSKARAIEKFFACAKCFDDLEKTNLLDSPETFGIDFI